MRQRRKKTKADLPVRREAERRWRISGRCLLPPILFPSPSVSDPLLSCSFSLFCIFFSPVLEMAKTVANLFFFYLIFGDENWFSSLPCCFFFRSRSPWFFSCLGLASPARSYVFSVFVSWVYPCSKSLSISLCLTLPCICPFFFLVCEFVLWRRGRSWVRWLFLRFLLPVFFLCSVVLWLL